MSATKPTSRAERLKSLKEWEAILQRYPVASPWGLAWQASTVFSSNVLVAWFVATGRMTPLELVLLVAVEAVLLIVIAWLQARFVPRQAIQRSPQTLGQRVFIGLFGLFWLACVYGLMLGLFVKQGAQVQQLIADPLAFFLASSIKWPLLVTLAGALVDALQDHAHFGRHGGTFMSTPAFQGGARLLTLFLGGIPFFMPMVAVVGGLYALITKTGELLRTRHGHDAQNLWMVLSMPAILLGFFATFAYLVTSEVSGWAIGYATAKFAAEIFIVCLPLIARQAHAEEQAALDGKPAKNKRGSRLP